ncbi:hypothetical protein EC2720900_3299 [Escherichia coli 2720900]|nr:hypothetical protein EC2720900_3299 [Escherichia coli 2720900]
MAVLAAFDYGGLSPLARGTRTCAGDFEPQSRFIPAGAGNTESKCFPIYFFAVYPRWRGEHFIVA